MTSAKQLAANRQNCSKSSGPISAEGKAAVSQNATRHGLLTEVTLLESEDRNAFKRLSESIYDSFRPIGGMEEVFVDRIVNCLWRLRRVSFIEIESLQKTKMGIFGDGEIPCYPFIDCGAQYSNLSRYETAIERSLLKALHELQRLQALRGGQNVPLPSVLDINISSSESAA